MSISEDGLLSVFSRRFGNIKPIQAALIALTVLVFAVVVIWAMNIVFWQTSVQVPRKTGLPTVATEALKPTALDQVLKIFAPWESPEINSSGKLVSDPRALAILREDGAMLVSSWGIQVLDGRWSIAEPPEISRMSVDAGKVTLVTNKGRTFSRVHLSQPFILEQTPQRVYVVTADRTILSIPTDVAETLRYRIE